MKKCRDADNRPHHMCRLFDGAPGYKLDELPISGGNDSSVHIDSIDGSDSKTVCFYNISMPDTSSSNCSGIKLEHASIHSREQYVDGLSDQDSATNSTDIPCKSYVKVFYGSEGSQQHTEPLCRDRLANLNENYPSTSLFIAYWTTLEESNASFQLKAECID